jgi:PAS domain S-box-containing protein
MLILREYRQGNLKQSNGVVLGEEQSSADAASAQTLPLPDWIAAEELYRIQVRELTHYAVFAIDPSGIILSWNAGVQQILGYSEDEWIGRHASIIFTPGDRAQEICLAELNLAAEKGSSADIRWHVRKDGSELFGQGCMTALKDDDGKLIGYSKIFSDETSNKLLQDKLTDSNAALEQFAYVASHDLQEPIRTVGSLAEVLVRRHRSTLDEDARVLLDLITKGAQRMTALVSDLLTFARVRVEIDRPSSFSLDENMETALSQLKAAIDDSSALVTHDPLPEIEADQGQMVRLFVNLIGNALKYRKPNVRPEIHVSSKEMESEWLIAIQDNGIGFDPKHAQDIFKPFKRLHSKEKYEGSGVGLAICQRIVANHGGRIWAESKIDEGTTFFFTLPIGGRAPKEFTPSVIADL